MRSIRSTFKRKPKKRVVSRSFRIPPAADRELDKAANARNWSKSALIREIIQQWMTYQQAKARVE